MVHDGWFARVVVSLAHAIHRVICVGAHFGHTSDRAMADGTPVMPRHFGANGDCLERLFFSSHIISPWRLMYFHSQPTTTACAARSPSVYHFDTNSKVTSDLRSACGLELPTCDQLCLLSHSSFVRFWSKAHIP